MGEMGLRCTLFGHNLKEIRCGAYCSKIMCVRCGEVAMDKSWETTN